MAGKSTTISNKATAIGAINIQQSTYGATVPIMWGRARLTGNLIWYGDFRSTPHTEVTQQGGKGGGGQKTSNTTYTYSAAVQMALCRGPIAGIRTVWRGKSVYRGTPGGAASIRTSETLTVGSGGVATVSNTANFVHISAQALMTGDFEYDQTKPNRRRRTLTQGIDYSVTSGGVYTFSTLALGDTVTVTYTYNSGAGAVSAMPELGMDLAHGNPGQAPWTYQTSLHPDQAVGYSTIAYVAASNYTLTENAQVDNHAFEVDGPLQFSASVPDANPADIVPDALNNPIYGAGFGDSRLGSMVDYRNACAAQGIFLSPVLSAQTTAAEFLDTLSRLTNVGLVWSNGVLKFVPYADVPMTGHGVTFSPATTPIYDLTDDDFLGAAGDPPVVVNRGSSADTSNSVKLEYCDRANDYNVAIMSASDDADILENGLREAEVIQAHWITEADVARVVVQLILQRSMFVRNTYEFRCKWTKIGLEAMDLVTLTDAGLGLDKYAVRILEMEEDGEGELSFLAEDFPQGSASATLYPTTTGIGFAHNYNAQPGNAGTPVIFEAPADLTPSNAGLEVWLATGSNGVDYGGCEVWVSLDGSNYQRAYVLKGSSRYGVTTSTLAGDVNPGTSSKSVNVALSAGGQLMSGSIYDRDRLTTLCYVGGEFLAYDAVALTGVDAYRLGPSLNRGAYGSGQGSRAAGVPFVRCDEGIARMTLTADYIGQTLYVKLLAFNAYQANTQGLADVVAHTYTVTGQQANLSPLAPPNLALEGPFTIDTAKFRWDAAKRAASYNVQVWAGSPLAKKREVNVGDARRFDYSSADAQADGGPWRALEVRVQGVNSNGAPGAFSALAVSNPQVGALLGVRTAPTGSTINFSCAAPADPDFDGVQVWLSTTQGFVPADGNLVYSGPNTSIAIGTDAAGAALVPGTPYYLKYAGYDSFDKAGLTIGASDAVTLLQQQLYATVMLFKWSTTKPSEPIGSSIFNWGTGQNGSYSGDDGWFSTIPDNPGTPGMQLWQSIKSITALSGTTSTTVTYTGVPITSTATNATAGAQTAIATVYQWAATIPAGPAGGGTYTWSNGNIGTVPASWLASAGASPSAGLTLFAASVRLIDSSSKTTTDFNWSSASIMAIGYAANDGTPGVARFVELSTTGQVFSRANSTGTFTPASVTLTATPFGGTATYGWDYWDGSSWVVVAGNPTTSTYVVNSALNNVPGSAATFRVRATMNGVVHTDEITLAQVTGGKDGSSAVSGYLTNESHTVTTASDGTGGSYAAAGGTFSIFDGVTAVATANVAFSVASSSNITGMAINAAGVYSLTGTSADVGTATLRAVYAGVTIEKVYSIGRSKTGVDGVARSVEISAPAQAFTRADSTGTFAPASIVLTATPQGGAASAYQWQYWTGSAWADLAGVTTATYSIASGNFTDARTYRVQATINSVVYTDEITLVKLTGGKDGTAGVDAIVALLTNESHTLGANSAGAVASYTGASTTMQVYVGATLATGWGFTASPPPSASTFDYTLNATTGVLTVTGLAAGTDQAFVDITAAKATFASLTKRFTVTKAKAGTSIQGSEGASYVTAYCASASLSTTTAPAVSSGKSSVPATNGGGIVGAWTKTVPALTSSQYLYQSDGIYDPATGNVTWSIPYWSSLKVGSLSAITANLGAITAGSIDIGSGTSSFHIDSQGNHWSGAGSYADAPYRVSNTGAVRMSSVDIVTSSGVVIISSGRPLSEQVTINPNLVPRLSGWPQNYNVAIGFSPTDPALVNGEYLYLGTAGAGSYVGLETNSIGIRQNGTYTVSFDAYVQGAARDLVVDLFGPNVDSVGITATLTNGWKRYSFTETITHADAPLARMRIFASNGAASGNMIVANVKLEVGPKVTPWCDNVVTASNVGQFIAPNAISNTQIGGNLTSSNYNYDISPTGLGWNLDRSGHFYCNSIYARGALRGGSFNGYAWPPAGQTGYYLGPEGLLIGNANNNKYFQATADGNVYAPNFTIINGIPTFSNGVINNPKVTTPFNVYITEIAVRGANEYASADGVAYVGINSGGNAGYDYQWSFSSNGPRLELVTSPGADHAVVRCGPGGGWAYGNLTVTVKNRETQQTSTASAPVSFQMGNYAEP